MIIEDSVVDKNSLSRIVAVGSFWAYMDRFITQLVGFVISVILARILAPEIYGTIALVIIFITIADVFVSSGFGNSLIQLKIADATDYSTVFIAGLATSIVLYLVLFFTAPGIARFYARDELIIIIRVMAIRVIFAAINSIQCAYVQKQFKFRIIFIAGVSSSAFSGLVGIFMAYLGYGVWALVAQNLIQTIVNTIILAITSGFRPILKFSLKRLKPLFSFGWKILLVNLTDILYANLGGLFIGKRYSSADLAFYNKGNQFPGIVVTNINSTINTVMFPVLSTVQDDVSRVKNITKRAIRTSTFLMSPLLVGLAVCAEPIVILILTEKWLNSVIYIQILCVVYLSMPVNSINQLVMNSLGRSDLFLKAGITKKILGIICTVGSIIVFGGPVSIAIASLISAPIDCYVNMHPSKKLIDYGIFEQLKDVFPSISLSLFMGVIVYFIGFIPCSTMYRLLIQVISGAVIYIGLAKLLNLEEFNFIFKTVISFFSKKENS